MALEPRFGKGVKIASSPHSQKLPSGLKNNRLLTLENKMSDEKPVKGFRNCVLCEKRFRSDRIPRHMAHTHRWNLTELMLPLCRTDAIQNKIPMIYNIDRGEFGKLLMTKPEMRQHGKKQFCVCLICDKGVYPGGHGIATNFYDLHRKSKCMEQWDSVAHLFGELPDGTPPPPPLPPSRDETAKDRLIQTLTEKIAELERDAVQTGKRFNELWKENEERKKQPQPPKAPVDFSAPPKTEQINAPSPPCPELPPEPEPEPEPEAEPPTLVVVPTEPEPEPVFAVLPLATVRKDPNEGKPGYFQAKSGKWIKKATGVAPPPPPPPPPAPEPQQSNLLETQATTNHTDPNEGRDGYFLARSGKWVRRLGGAMPRPSTTLLPVKPPPVVPKAPTLTLNIDDLLAELTAPPTDAEKAAIERENEEFQVNEILNGIVEHEWTADETKDYISEREEEMNLTAVLKRRCLHAILRFADGEDNFEEIAEIQRA